MKNEISSLQTANRVEIFRHIAVDDLDIIKSEVLDLISSKHFHEFIDFCDKVYEEKDRILDVSCEIDAGRLNFLINYK